MNRYGVLASLMVVATVAGCGKSSSSKDERLTAERFLAQYVHEVCSAAIDCSCRDASTLSDCEAGALDYYNWYLGIAERDTQGVRFDEVAGKTCLDDLKAEVSTCPSPDPVSESSSPVPAIVTEERPRARVASCERELLFVGAQAAGAYCESYGECAEGLACDYRIYQCVPLGDAGATCGVVPCKDGYYCGSGSVCVALGDLDADCTADSQCKAGLFCKDGSSCAARLTAGAECTGETQCADGLSCVWGPIPSNVCLAPHAVGDRCDMDGAGCASGSFCDPALDPPSCTALRVEGAECAESYECAHGACNPDPNSTTGKKVCVNPGFCSIVEEYWLPWNNMPE